MTNTIFTQDDVDEIIEWAYNEGASWTLNSGKEIAIVHVGDWVSEGKWDSNEFVVEYGGKFYLAHRSRTGSYYSDYEYQEPKPVDFMEAKKVTRTIEVWEAA